MSFTSDLKARFADVDISALSRFAENLAAGFRWLARRPCVRGHHVLSYGEMRLPLLAVVSACGLIALVLFLDARTRAAAWVWALDGSAIRAAKRLPEWVVVVFNELTDFGKSGWFLVPLGLALLAIAAVAAIVALSRMSRLLLAAVAIRLEFLFIAIALPGLIANIFKRVIGRGRPFVGGDVDVYSPINAHAAYQSLPSGHSTTAFSVLVAFGALFPAWRRYLWAYAIVIAISRVVVIAHHPTDVLAGALLGALGALLVRNAFAARRRGFAADSEGSVRPMPGPSWVRIKTVARAITGQ